jgi:Tol biopolymer transport system component
MKPYFFLLLVMNLLFSCSTSEKLVFSSSRNGNSDIYIMNAKGQQLTQLTNTKAEEWAPTVFSESEITFLRQEGELIQRVKLDIQTKQETILPHPEHCILDDKNMQYGPLSGRQLYQCKEDIYLADKKGKNAVNLTKKLGGRSFKAAWAADESLIVFTNQQEDSQDIYAVQADGSGLRQITNHPANEEAPALSPDGKYLLFSSNRDGNRNQELYILDLATQVSTNITNTPDWELIGRWSNDGKHIYYGSNKDGNWELYRYDLKDQSHHRLTNNDAFDGDPRVIPRP